MQVHGHEYIPWRRRRASWTWKMNADLESDRVQASSPSRRRVPARLLGRESFSFYKEYTFFIFFCKWKGLH